MTMSVSRESAAALAAVAGVMLLQGLYAMKLNADFYKVHAPFYDSCSYTNELADVACTVRTEGFGSGVKKSLSGNVALPWLEMTVLAKIFTPSRYLAIWLQVVWFALLALSICWYLIRYRGVPVWLGFCLTLPFVSFARVYEWNGGLPDFRMDLSLYIFTSLCAVWYLATYETESRIPWLLSGIAAMLACLARATAPVYLIVMLGPLLTIRFLNSPGRRKTLALNCVWMCVPIAFAVGAFLVYNFSFLYFYYVTWSPDANRHLPLRQSYPHLVMTLWHLGYVMVDCGLAALAVSFLLGLPKQIRQIDGKIVWLALSAPLFLFFRGAGMNPFVSMPAVFGSLLFVYLPFRGAQPAFRRGWACLLLGVLAAGSSIFNALTPNVPRPYVGPSSTRMAGFKSVIERVTRDATVRGLHEVEYIAPESGDFHYCAFSNVLTYEFGALPGKDGDLNLGGRGEARALSTGLTFRSPHRDAFTATDELLWKLEVPGQTEKEKMDSLVSMAMQSGNYLLVPDEPTLDWLEHNIGFNYINLKTRELKTRLLATGEWVQLGGAAATSEHESIVVYARRKN
jgi:hypothetical protein